jgi:ABC-2 type transport system ATP-binding protein
LSVTDKYIEPVDGLFSILSTEQTGNYTEVHIQKEAQISNSVLLSALAQQYDIHSFVEELPSMNEVFIQTVKM